MVQGLILGQKGIIKSIQSGEISLYSTSNTATLSTAVDVDNCMLIYGGRMIDMNSSDGQMNTIQSWITLTNSTTVTAGRYIDDGDDQTIRFTVVEFHDGFVKSNQWGYVSVGSVYEATTTITAVDTDKAVLVFHGQYTTVGYSTSSSISQRGWLKMWLSDSTTVKARKTSYVSDTTRGYFQVIEFY